MNQTDLFGASNYADPKTNEAVPWASADPELLSRIAAAPWKVVDIETTGLTPASKPINFTGKDLRRGVNPNCRMRVLSVLFGDTQAPQVESFDCDQLSVDELKALCDAVFDPRGDNIGWNYGFDAYWIGRLTKLRPRRMLDAMLITRVLQPEVPLMLARMAQDENDEHHAQAFALFRESKSGWSLDAVSMALLGMPMDKTLQGPRNWAEPFLTYANYVYATGDVRQTFAIMHKVLGVKPGECLAEAFDRVQHADVRVARTIPQVPNVLGMREKGMPWDEDEAAAFVAATEARIREQADKLIELEPTLEPMRLMLRNPGEGISAALKQQIAQAFEARGLVLETTELTGSFKIGEKDLRRAKAQIEPRAAVLFDVWIGLAKAKKVRTMALENTGFMLRSGDGRLHPLTGHGPVTGRLSSAEPNAQQFPRAQEFRNIVRARPGFKISSSDYSALDMRVGAALAIRAQRQIREVYLGDRTAPDDVYNIIMSVYQNRVTPQQARRIYETRRERLNTHRNNRDQIMDRLARQQRYGKPLGSFGANREYWKEYRDLARAELLARFGKCLSEVLARARARGDTEWSMLRDAFDIPGMDIHTWTALGMVGRDPNAEFAGKTPEQIVEALKEAKAQIGDGRQTGKVGNLSLLYAMQVAGLVETAARAYNIHWTIEQGTKVRDDWFATYIEIDLWHAWTELNCIERVRVPDPDAGGQLRNRQVYRSVTLGGREIIAFGLNAALSYEDQSTGADVLALAMDMFDQRYPEVYATIINQIHDEVLFELPDEHVADYERKIAEVMTEAVEFFLSPYGVKGESSPATGPCWLKD